VNHLNLLACDKRNDQCAYLNAIQGTLAQEGYSVSAQQAWHGSPNKTITHLEELAAPSSSPSLQPMQLSWHST
jgi:hypothetical protein